MISRFMKTEKTSRLIYSEETGNIATTIRGTISSGVTLEGLRVSLEQNIIVK